MGFQRQREQVVSLGVLRDQWKDSELLEQARLVHR